jgi:hypothetical protein
MFLSVSTTAKNHVEKARKEYKNDARGQRLFFSSVFNVRPFFFWASFCLFSYKPFRFLLIHRGILRISSLYALARLLNTAYIFSSFALSSTLSDEQKITLRTYTMRCFVFLRCVTKKLDTEKLVSTRYMKISFIFGSGSLRECDSGDIIIYVIS